MNRSIKILCFTFLLAFCYSCNSDKNSNVSQAINQNETETKVEAKVQAKNETEILSEKEIVEEKEEKVIEAKKVETDKRQNSEIKDLTCSDIINKYEKAINLLKKNLKDPEGLKSYKVLRNDPKFKDCRSDKEYKSKFKELDKLYYSLR